VAQCFERARFERTSAPRRTGCRQALDRVSPRQDVRAGSRRTGSTARRARRCVVEPRCSGTRQAGTRQAGRGALSWGAVGGVVPAGEGRERSNLCPITTTARAGFAGVRECYGSCSRYRTAPSAPAGTAAVRRLVRCIATARRRPGAGGRTTPGRHRGVPGVPAVQGQEGAPPRVVTEVSQVSQRSRRGQRLGGPVMMASTLWSDRSHCE
jgi:hypothetical protein